MTDEIDDFLGEGPEDVRPKKPKAAPSAKLAPADSTVVQALTRPVSVSFLCDVWGMERSTIVKRLASLPPVGQHRGNQPLYDFRQAAQYLVTPRVDVSKYVKSMGVADLPVSLQKDVWDAKLKQQKWALLAGELWRTNDVVEVLGDTFQRIKTTTQLWVDQIAEEKALPEDVRAELTALVDGLNRDVYDSLVVMVKERRTPAQSAEIEGSELDG